jgi:hypothetical protein
MTARGKVGCAVLSTSRRGRVKAVFSNSAHVFADGVYLTLGNPSLPAHAYSVLWPGYGDLRAGQEIVVSANGLTVNGRLRTKFAEMEVYTPREESHPSAGRMAIVEALIASRDAVAQAPGTGGLAQILIACKTNDGSSYLAAHFAAVEREHCAAFARAIGARDRAGALRTSLQIAGAGAGLTPSGDDFLGGAVAALRYYTRSTGDEIFAQSVFDNIAAHAAAKSSRFSAFLLAAAARGWVAEPVAGWLDAVHRGDSVAARQRIPEIACLGHSSGLDTLTGMLLTLAAALGETEWIN